MAARTVLSVLCLATVASAWSVLASPAGDANCSSSNGANASSNPTAPPPQLALLDLFFPGFSGFAATIQRYTHIDLNLYIPVVLFVGGVTFVWQYVSDFAWGKLESYFMSTCLLRTDDEAYNYIMAWVAKQKFSLRSRRFIVNTNTNSRSWFTWRWDYDEDEEDEYEGPEDKKKPLSYTPTFGSHYFFYKGHLMTFHRIQNREQASFLSISQREEISISCLGRNPTVLKELLLESRDQYLKRDEKKTAIYRGTTKAGQGDPTWQRCMARTSRPFSTVILNEKVKKDLIDDVTDYLDPATRRWYANRGIPYRRGYLLHGPPGTGKSSLSLALAGFFKMRIYIVSLSSIHANEENLSSLFAELPRRCVVLLEDIDTAGLTHTRDAPVEEAPAAESSDNKSGSDSMVPGQLTQGIRTPVVTPVGRLSLSGLLNILDGVASQEGRVLIMTTNHVEKLDKALIRPGRVDMIVNFGRADSDMVSALFRAIYAPLEGDNEPDKAPDDEKAQLDLEAEAKRVAEAKRKREEAVARVSELAEQFAAKVPAHEFSPAELQGFLMKNKRHPETAVAGVDEWVVTTRKEKKEKELKEAEDKRKKEEEEKKEAQEKKEKEEKEAKEKKEAEEKEAKEKKEKEKKEKDKEARRKKRKEKKSKERKEPQRTSSRKSRKAERDDSSSSSSDDSDDSASDVDEPAAPAKKTSADAGGAAAPAAPATTTTASTSSPSSDPATPDQSSEDEPVQPVAKPDVVLDKIDTAVASDLKTKEGKTGMDSGYET